MLAIGNKPKHTLPTDDYVYYGKDTTDSPQFSYETANSQVIVSNFLVPRPTRYAHDNTEYWTKGPVPHDELVVEPYCELHDPVFLDPASEASPNLDYEGSPNLDYEALGVNEEYGDLPFLEGSLDGATDLPSSGRALLASQVKLENLLPTYPPTAMMGDEPQQHTSRGSIKLEAGFQPIEGATIYPQGLHSHYREKDSSSRECEAGERGINTPSLDNVGQINLRNVSRPCRSQDLALENLQPTFGTLQQMAHSPLDESLNHRLCSILLRDRFHQPARGISKRPRLQPSQLALKLTFDYRSRRFQSTHRFDYHICSNRRRMTA